MQACRTGMLGADRRDRISVPCSLPAINRLQHKLPMTDSATTAEERALALRAEALLILLACPTPIRAE